MTSIEFILMLVILYYGLELGKAIKHQLRGNTKVIRKKSPLRYNIEKKESKNSNEKIESVAFNNYKG